jgi:L-threonylcarbamoyladenylate synthase
MNENEVIQKAVQHLKNGDTILTPTDTIWGLSCDATNNKAVSRLRELKKRNPDQSFIILVNSDRMFNQCVKNPSDLMWELIEYATDPLTLVVQGTRYISGEAINEDGTIGIRYISSGICDTLLSKFQKPLVSTSANFTAEPTPLYFEDINEELIAKVDFTMPLRYAEEMSGKPSKIMKIDENGEVKILRS